MSDDPELLLIMTSREQPVELKALLAELRERAGAPVDIVIGLENDDPEILTYWRIIDDQKTMFLTGDHRTHGAWIWYLASVFGKRYRVVTTYDSDQAPADGWALPLLAGEPESSGVVTLPLAESM